MEICENEFGNDENNDVETTNMDDTCKKRKLHSDVDDNVYYGVHVPNSLECQLFEDIEKTNVFTDKIEALKLVKKFKKARFKVFNYYHEAVAFATHGGELPNSNLSFTPGTPRKDPEKDVSPAVASEKCQFRGPKSQDLVKLRKAIESNDLNYVERTVWENPRYLVSSGDTPSILQEGFRYNGLHVAAKAKNAEMCELILNTVGNTGFIEKLYGDDSHQNSEDRSKILLDLYLNTPDKGLNETPLHFAVKFGALKVTEVLVSFPQCDKNVRNKYGKLPSQIICDRCDGHIGEQLKEQIATILEDNYYVPVLRSEDNCTPPVVGEPFSPVSPPNLDNDPLMPRLEIHAYAGPMDRKGADKFRKMWKTPPRSIGNNKWALNHKGKKLCNSLDSISSYNLKLCDPEKGLEAVGRELATKYNVTWKEYWPFLDNFTDIGSIEGLQQFERYLLEQNEKIFVNLSSPKITEATKTSKTESPNFIDSLCKKFEELCNLDDDEDSIMIMTEGFNNQESVCPFVCVERSLKIFANRISNILKNLIRNEDIGDFTSNHLLTAEIKLFEQLIVSYIDDKRFSEINFEHAHPRLAVLIISHLRCKDNNIVWSEEAKTKLREICNRNLDFFITNDEMFSANKHLPCILRNILKLIDEETIDVDAEDCQRMWENADTCSCLFSSKQNKQKYGLRRRNSNNNHLTRKNNGVKLGGNTIKNNFNGISKNLFNVDNHDDKIVLKISSDDSDESSSEDDDQFFTPPSSPSLINIDYLSDDEDEDSFADSQLPDADVFIEGSEPTKIDRDVYDALIYSSDKINPKDFPNIYKWRHAVSLYADEDRKSWSSPKPEYHVADISVKITSTPCRGNVSNKDSSFSSPPVYASPKSWFRITGPNSPRASLNTYKNNLSFNL